MNFGVPCCQTITDTFYGTSYRSKNAMPSALWQQTAVKKYLSFFWAISAAHWKLVYGVYKQCRSESLLHSASLWVRSRNSLALAKRRRKLTQVEDLGQLATSFGQGLRALALTCDDLPSLWSRSNLHASRSKLFTVWLRNPSQRKLSNVH